MENIIFHVSLMQTLEITAKNQSKIFMCLFLPSAKFFLQISKWFLGSVDVNKRVLFHVKWYHPESCWSAGFFPRVGVRWSRRWPFIYNGRSWSPELARCLQLSPLALLGVRLPCYGLLKSLLLSFPVSCAYLEPWGCISSEDVLTLSAAGGRLRTFPWPLLSPFRGEILLNHHS